MNEAETRAEHIDPALAAAGWGLVEGSRIRREELSGETQILKSIYQQKLTALDDLKTSLLHQAFSGQL